MKQTITLMFSSIPFMAFPEVESFTFICLLPDLRSRTKTYLAYKKDDNRSLDSALLAHRRKSLANSLIIRNWIKGWQEY